MRGLENLEKLEVVGLVNNYISQTLYNSLYNYELGELDGWSIFNIVGIKFQKINGKKKGLKINRII